MQAAECLPTDDSSLEGELSERRQVLALALLRVGPNAVPKWDRGEHQHQELDSAAGGHLAALERPLDCSCLSVDRCSGGGAGEL